ncbi:MAG: peptidoglycan DD-metalloendopeptidase family protein [Limibacillus sp.]
MPSRTTQRKFPNRPGAGLLAAACWLLLAPGLAAASEEARESDLKSLEQQLQADRERADALAQETEALRAEMETLRGQLVASAERAQDLEEDLSTLEQTLAVLEVEESRARLGLEERRRQMAGILQGLQRLSLVPRESLILAPGKPIDLARGGILLQAAYPTIEAEAQALRADLADLASLRAGIVAQREELQSAETALSGERESLVALLSRKEALEAEASGALAEARARAERLAREAQDLRGLLERLEEERRLSLVVLPKLKPEFQPAPTAPEPAEQPESAPAGAEESAPQVASLTPPSVTAPSEIRAFPDDPASLVLPARGSFSRRFGETLPGTTGGRSKGLFIQAREGAQVVAPSDGRVVYAQPFRGYGLILIIEHRGKYHSLLSGLERIDAVEGQWVLAGEPIGVLGSPTAGKPELYLELRRDGQPIDPLPWLALTGDKQTNEKVKS